MTRKQGKAPGAALVQAVQRAGYRARVSPTLQLKIDVPGMDCDGCPERVQNALRGCRGVRAIQFPTRDQVIVFYDGRRVSPQQLIRAIQRSGFSPRSS